MRILKTHATTLCLFFISFFYAQGKLNKEINDILKPYENLNSPGFGVKVIKDNKLIYSKNLGFSNLDYGIKNSDSTVFGLASVSKQFTASTIWVLSKEGKINLEDDVRKYLPELPKYKAIIKIKHLLNHTSGIRNYHALMDLSGFDYDKIYYDNQYVYELACKQKGLNNNPGEKVTYSNTNYNLLALIIERISGLDLNRFLKEKILNPLGMDKTFVRVKQGQVIKNKVIGYQKRKKGFVYNVTNQLSYGAGSMGSTTNDMVLWMQMLNGQVPEFKDLSIFLKTTDTLTTGEQSKYARGINVDNYKGYLALNHGGYGFGTRSQLITIPDKGIGVIVLSNLQSINAQQLGYQIIDTVLSEALEENKEKDIFKSFKAQNLNLFTGEFKEIHSDMTMKLFIEKDTLMSIGSLGKVPAPLIQFAKNKFHRVNSQNVKYEFDEDENHDMIIRFGGTPFYFKKAKFIKENIINIKDYIGEFYSEELDVIYTFFIEDDKLKLSYYGNENINLHPIQLNEFGNNRRTLYHFVKDKNNNVTDMFLSCDGTINGITFKKKTATNQ